MTETRQFWQKCNMGFTHEVTDPSAPPLPTLDKLKAVIRDMRLEAREWEGINPINRRVARRLTTWADRLEAAIGALRVREEEGHGEQQKDQGAVSRGKIAERE